MRTNHDSWYVRRDDDIHISEAGVKFFEGEIVTEDRYDIDTKSMKPVTFYKRLKRLRKKDLPHFKDKRTMLDANGNEAIVFTPENFGEISTDEELNLFLNKELARDKSREPIDEQKWQP